MISGPSVDVPESRCPHCKAKLDAAFEVGGDDSPSQGNVSLCLHCGNWMVYGPDMKLTQPSSKLLARIKTDRKCQIAYHAVMKLRRQRAAKN